MWRKRMFAAAMIILLAGPCGWAQDSTWQPVTDTSGMKGAETDPAYLKLNGEYLRSIPKAFVYTVSAPFHWKGKDWRKAGLAGLAIGGTLLADREIKQTMLANRSKASEELAHYVEPFGNNYGPFLLVGMLAVGKIAKQPRMEHASLTGTRSLLISTVVYTSVKGLVRRNRPTYTDNPFDFRAPFRKEITSFPSGHTNTAFSIATALALEYSDKKWVPWTSYGIATLTSVSRLYHNRHWSSDVLVGALMGHFITKGLYHWERKRMMESLPKHPPAL